MRFFTADTHFSLDDYSGVVQRDFRPFRSCRQMNKTFIKNLNSAAKKGDTIYFLGDFVNYNKSDSKNYPALLTLVKKIKADVVLILGNNEERLMKYEFGGDFEKLKNYLLAIGFKDVILGGTTVEIGQTKFYLTHEPKNHRGDKNLFGHIHSAVLVKKYGYNVGVDVNHFRPFSENDILFLEDKRNKFYDENVYE